MDIKNLATFIQVAELSSFSRAGDKLGYSQPTVSFQIRQLEQELGVRLFDRIGHTVQLTDRGREVLAHAQKVCHMYREMTQLSEKEAPIQGTVRLAMADSLCGPLLGDLLPRLRRENPGLHLNVTTGGTDELFRLLDQNQADIVCTLDSHSYDTNYIIAWEEKVGVHFVVSSQSPLVQKSCLQKEDLLQNPLLLTEKGMSYRRLLDQWLARDSLELQPVLEAGRADVLCKLAEKGLGIAFLPDYVTQTAVDRGILVRLELAGFAPELWRQVLYHRDKWLSRPMEQVLSHLCR